MNLVVGASGYLGTDICSQLRAAGKPVRALIRPTTDPARRALLEQLGVEIIVGDLTSTASLRAACIGVRTVISSATIVRSAQPADTFTDVDDAGQRALVDVARDAGVAHFIFVSVSGNIAIPCPLIDAKRKVEQHIKQSGIGYTVLRPSAFMEVWLGALAGFDHTQRTATILGSGDQQLSFIAQADVARFAVAVSQLPQATNRFIELGGPKAISPNEALAVFETIAGGSYQVHRVPAEAIRGQYEAAEHPVQKSFAALMLALVADDVIPMQKTAAEFGITLRPLIDVARLMVPVNV